MLSSVQRRPCDSPRVLALEEERFGFAVLEAEDFAVATNVDFALSKRHYEYFRSDEALQCEEGVIRLASCHHRQTWVTAQELWGAYLPGIDLLTTEGIFKSTHVGGKGEWRSLADTLKPLASVSM